MRTVGDEVKFFPGAEDVEGAAVALMRLQDTYKLSTEDLAKGEADIPLNVGYANQI